MQQEELFRNRITELADAAYARGIVTFSDFLDLNEQTIAQSIRFRDHGVTMQLEGGYETAERRMAIFLPDEIGYEWSPPIAVLKIEPRSKRFAEHLTHRDFLGAILSLGIERCLIGDLLIRDASATLFCMEHIADFIIDELSSVRRTPVTAERVSPDADFEIPVEEMKSGSVASVRLDSLVALAFRIGRSDAAALIKEGRVFVNAKLVTSNGHPLHEMDLISVRGHGKFRYHGVTHTTKKGRSFVEISVFV
jgi:RNA-binding protein YlmH